MKIFMVCSKEGGIIDVVEAKTFEEAYADTIGLNRGELLVEVTKEDLEKLNSFKKSRKHR